MEIEQARRTEAQKRKADAKRIEGLQKQITIEKQRAKEREAELRAVLSKEAEDKAARKVSNQLRSLKQTLEKTIDEKRGLERRLEHLTASERGAFSEGDLKRSLEQSFPGDNIIPRGRGGDILHEIYYRAGAEQVQGGLIVYECKDTADWHNSFIPQVREAAIAHRTPYAVLVTKSFPPKRKDLL
jgi:hypothetical protein